MERVSLLVATAVLTWSFTGCGQSDQPAGSSVDVPVTVGTTVATAPSLSINDDDAPDMVVFKFLEAVRLGEDGVAESLLTPLAREKTRAMDMVVAPPGSDTASFRVGEVQRNGDICQVLSQWTDLDGNGEPKTDEITWTVRRVGSAWRIAGMAAKIFPDLPPVVMNYEDPEEMVRQRQLAEEEAARRHSAAPPENREARRTDDPFQSGPK